MTTEARIDKGLWWDESWNPTVGCTPNQIGCQNCYARALHTMRNKAYMAVPDMPKQYALPFSEVQLIHGRLTIPLHWRKPRTVFVDSMSDLFHKDVPGGFIDKVWDTMARCPQHTFIVLTKRPDRMEIHVRSWLLRQDGKESPIGTTQPLPNVWLGTSISNQADMSQNHPHLMRCPAAVRFLSYEPALGPIALPSLGYTGCPTVVDWIIVGCESGPNRRPCKLEWVEDIVAQADIADFPVFAKQLAIDGRVSKNMAEWPEWAQRREIPITQAK